MLQSVHDLLHVPIVLLLTCCSYPLVLTSVRVSYSWVKVHVHLCTVFTLLELAQVLLSTLDTSSDPSHRTTLHFSWAAQHPHCTSSLFLAHSFNTFQLACLL